MRSNFSLTKIARYLTGSILISCTALVPAQAPQVTTKTFLVNVRNVGDAVTSAAKLTPENTVRIIAQGGVVFRSEYVDVTPADTQLVDQMSSKSMGRLLASDAKIEPVCSDQFIYVVCLNHQSRIYAFAVAPIDACSKISSGNPKDLEPLFRLIDLATQVPRERWKPLTSG